MYVYNDFKLDCTGVPNKMLSEGYVCVFKPAKKT